MKRAVLFAAMLAACTPTIYDVSGVTESNAADVAGCRFIGNVRGIPAVFGPLKDIGLKDARRAAKVKAKEVGGNTVVFEAIPEVAEVYDVPAKVYSC
ncbi:hypothetical protein BCF46_2494 [Litoreibacter meonggei]|uniref:Uncharacterized protein n=2 Tax=Litoreibacter meonggei TaxID=1049199 RepID=A0A497VMV3_9RHOB|nr:hypothetical protein BCF46_2494 [Litoreibacter meonggei]